MIGHSVQQSRAFPEKSAALGFRGTRIPVSAVFENLEDGLTIDQIVSMFDGLSREQVKAVLDFTAHSLDTPASVR